MNEKIILKIGDTVEYHNNKKATIEKIRIISKGEFIEQFKYDGKANNIVLTLRDNVGVFNLWLKDNPIRIMEEKKEKKKS